MARILIIDDDRAVGQSIQIALERAGFEVTVLGDGRAGLEAAKSGDFDLLIVDIFMPGMDGLETMRLVREHKPRMPIVVMSGLTFRSSSAPAPDFLAMATKLGAVRSLQKPFRPRELLAVIEECLELSVGAREHAPAQSARSSSEDPSAA
jgi:DNA-binding response OmpR family regulator